MAFPALDALREGYDIYPVVDAIGGTSEEAHRAGLERAREKTVADVVEIVLTERLLKA
jgi:Isochorismatase family